MVAPEDWSPFGDCLVLTGVGAHKRLAGDGINISALRNPDAIEIGDVLRVREGSSQISILYRRGSQANTLFVTERCNSLCLMCSQPPRDEDDSWRVNELIQTIRLIDKDEAQIGFTGGEPTLLGEDFASILIESRAQLPNTHLHVLTNGRRFADTHLAQTFVAAGSQATVWAVPLYADVADIHDEIVVAPGAFEETLAGLYNLAINRARVEIRVVLHALSVPRLRQLASYIYRRMPFVEHVAFMGLEPMGFARANREKLWIDPVDYQEHLAQSVHHLASRGMNVSIYNLPLCVLTETLWPFARQSISDWKNVVDEPACLSCAAIDQCSGFFLSADQNWRSRAIHPISIKELTHEMA
ncbi:His-Xaa-Ser system radical SAM maturase HxsC [Vitreimonas sp.]|uniref:His-Xaa-Ser system radical SAM maturase HxsC n=1 Tax=Vitreimonas sp. TaxID=3069702 RepID=UPI002ED7AF1F